MIWTRLKNGKCPDCNRPLVEEKGKKVYCPRRHFIFECEEFEGIINRLYTKRRKEWNLFFNKTYEKNI